MLKQIVYILLLCNIYFLKAQSPSTNIILLMADDLGWGDVNVFNSKTKIKTPELDKMAQSGIQFNRFYASSPVCSPTRGSSITGRHPYRYGVYYANTGYMKTEELTLAELLKAKGYMTGHFGKWHLGTMTTEMEDANRGAIGNTEEFSPPWKNGFDICFSTESKVPTWDPMLKSTEKSDWSGHKNGWDYIQDKNKAEAYGTHYWNEKGQIVKGNLEGDDSRVIMDRVIPFIQKAKTTNKAFFAVVWFHTPHLPVVAGPKYAAMYPNEDGFKKNYYGAVTALDEQVGRLRRELKKIGIAENTMIWFCSDNGPEGGVKNPGSAAHFKGRKRSLNEGGVRVPGILDWPSRVKAGTKTDFPAVTSDYLPTILDLLNVTYVSNRPLDGISLLPLIDGKMTVREKGIGFQSRGSSAWSSQQYKIIKNKEKKAWELYDIINDPSEKNNIASAHPKIVTDMSQKFEVWKNSCQRSDKGKDYKNK